MPENIQQSDPLVPTPDNKKRILFAIIIVIVIVGVFLLVWRWAGNPFATQQEEDVTPDGQDQIQLIETPGVTTTKVTIDKLPQRFPTDIPLEEGAQILQNYNAEAEDKGLQATRNFATSKTLQENFDLYISYLENNEWTITNTLDDEKLKYISADRDGGHMQITIQENFKTGVKTVDITITYSY